MVFPLIEKEGENMEVQGGGDWDASLDSFVRDRFFQGELEAVGEASIRVLSLCLRDPTRLMRGQFSSGA